MPRYRLEFDVPRVKNEINVPTNKETKCSETLTNDNLTPAVYSLIKVEIFKNQLTKKSQGSITPRTECLVYLSFVDWRIRGTLKIHRRTLSREIFFLKRTIRGSARYAGRGYTAALLDDPAQIYHRPPRPPRSRYPLHPLLEPARQRVLF